MLEGGGDAAHEERRGALAVEGDRGEVGVAGEPRDGLGGWGGAPFAGQQPAARALTVVVSRCERLVSTALKVAAVSRSGFWLNRKARSPYLAVCSSSAARFPDEAPS